MRLEECCTTDASVVTISISTTRMASENYGYMAPIKAGLSIRRCHFWRSRSAVFAGAVQRGSRLGLLKTSASAGIPGYVDSYFMPSR